jgi:ankyrin repeat protein
VSAGAEPTAVTHPTPSNPHEARQVLHVAVLRRAEACVRALLELDFPMDTKNRTGWRAMDEAVAGGSHSMVA